MSAGREGFDLLSRHGRRNFFRYLFKQRRFQRLMWRDTFGRVLCWLAGDHMIHQGSWCNGVPETSCLCCMKWLEQDGYKWKVKK